MTWSPLAPNQYNETPKTRWRAVPFTAGKGIDIGCGRERLFETETVLGIDNGSGAEQFGITVQANIRAEAKELPFSNSVWDFVYSSFMLQYIAYKEVPHYLREMFRVVRPGGCVVLYLPDPDQVPKCRGAGAWHPRRAAISGWPAMELYLRARRRRGREGRVQLGPVLV